MNRKRRILAHGTALLPKLRENHNTDNDPVTPDVVDKVAWAMLPPGNRTCNDNAVGFSMICSEIRRILGMTTRGQLEEMVRKYTPQLVEADRRVCQEISEGCGNYITTKNRQARGVFYSHVGLLRFIYRSTPAYREYIFRG